MITIILKFLLYFFNMNTLIEVYMLNFTTTTDYFITT